MGRVFGIGFVSLWLGVVLSASSSLASPFNFDNVGDVTLSPVPAPGTWYTDRYAPAGFTSGQVAPDSRPGTLRHTISAADGPGSRPPAYSGAFYNTQGRKHDFAPGLTSAYVQMYVSGSWDSLTQVDGRLGSLWATGFDNMNTVASYPIIEFNNAVDGFRVWASGAWVNVGGFAGYDQWYDIGFTLNGNQIDYFVNGSLVFSDANIGGTTNFGNLILQGYNSGNTYDIYWDNLRPNGQPMPEPASIGVWCMIGAVSGLVSWRRRRAKSPH